MAANDISFTQEQPDGTLKAVVAGPPFAELAFASNQEAQRTALGLGPAATMGVGITPGTVAAGDDLRLVGAVQRAGDTMSGPLTVENDFIANGSHGLAATYLLCSGDADFTNLPVFADNTAAATLPAGRVYRTPNGDLKIKY